MKDLQLPKKIISVSGYGLSRPLKPNTTDLFRANNRRVVIKILKDKEKKKLSSAKESEVHIGKK